jgi:NMD protein affecting ribosome stability and mRNA decay
MTKNSNKNMAVKTGMIGRRHQRSRKEESEFGLAGREFIICSDCGSVYFDKSWHHRLEEEKSEHLKTDRQVKFELCPACKMAKNKLFEGELVIRFKINDLRLKNDVMNTVKNSDEQAREKDPMDRILWTEEREDGIHIFTSENQLAVRIGKKLKSSFSGSTLEIKHSGEDIIRVYIEI